jgi:hypothetical protein
MGAAADLCIYDQRGRRRAQCPFMPAAATLPIRLLKGSKIENNRWIAFLWTFAPLNLCVEKSLAYKSHAVEKRYRAESKKPFMKIKRQKANIKRQKERTRRQRHTFAF